MCVQNMSTADIHPTVLEIICRTMEHVIIIYTSYKFSLNGSITITNDRQNGSFPKSPYTQVIFPQLYACSSLVVFIANYVRPFTA